jgi:3-oxoacyl-[acyl-carrier-protein] synthase-3
MMSKIVIDGMEYVEAPEILTSLEIESRMAHNSERFGLSPGYIEAMSGIRERRIWEPGKLVWDAAILSAEKLLQRLNIDRSEIGCLINPSVSRDYVEPTITIMVHNALGLGERCMNLDINNACMGFTSAVEVISNMLRLGQIKYGLIVNAESSRDVIDITTKRLADPEIGLEDFIPEFASLTLGSGSVSMLLCREEDARFDGHVIEETMVAVDSRYGMLCYGDHNQMRCEAHTMLKKGLELVKRTWDICMEEFEVWGDQIDRFVPHQVSMPHKKAFVQTTGVPMEKLELIFPEYGNTGPIAWPMGLAVAERKKNIGPGSKVAVFSMGSGFNSSCMRITW